MFSKLLNTPVPEFTAGEIEGLNSKIIACFRKGNPSYEDFVNAINENFQNEIKKHDSFFSFNDTPEEKAKRDILQAWQKEILKAVEGKKDGTVALDDVNGVLYDAAQCLYFGINPEAYRLLCLSTIREALDNDQWIHNIDGLAYTDKAKQNGKPSPEELNSFLKEKVAPVKTDEEWERQLKDKSLPFSMSYDRVKAFISKNNIFNGKELSPLQKIAFDSIFLSSAQKANLEINKAFPKKANDWIDLIPNFLEKLKLSKTPSHSFEQAYNELFSETEDLHIVAEKAEKKIEELTTEKLKLPEVNTGLDGFLEGVVQMKDAVTEAVVEKFDEIGQMVASGNEEINEGIDRVVDVVAETAAQAGKIMDEIIENVNKPEPYEPFFTQDPKFIWNYRLDVDEQGQSFFMTIDKSEKMANLKAYFKDRINEISELEEDSYRKFKEKFAEELHSLFLSERVTEGLPEKSVDFENLNLNLRFALPFNLLKESLSQSLDAEGQRRINELSSLITESTSNVFNQWVSKKTGEEPSEELGEEVVDEIPSEEIVSEKPSVSQIDYVLEQMQKASAYFSTEFQDKLDRTIETLSARKNHLEETEAYFNELEEYIQVPKEKLAETDREDLRVVGRKTLEAKREEFTSLKEQLEEGREQFEAEKKQFEAERMQMLAEIEDYPGTVDREKGWEFTASLLDIDSSTLQDGYKQQIQDKAKEEERKIEEEQRKLAEEKQIKIAEEQEKQRKQEVQQQELAAWQPKKNACLRLIDKEIKRLDGFSLFANDEITQERIVAFRDLRKKVEKTKNIGQLSHELERFEGSTIPFIRENEIDNRAVSDILKSDRFSFKSEISENTESNKFFQLLKKRAMIDYVVHLNSQLNKEIEPIARKSLAEKIAEFMQKIVQIGKKKALRLEVVEEVKNPEQMQVLETQNLEQPKVLEVQKEDPLQSIKEKVLDDKEATLKIKVNPKNEKAINNNIIQTIKNNKEWFPTHWKCNKPKEVISQVLGSKSNEEEIRGRQLILGGFTEAKIKAIAKVIKEIEKLLDKDEPVSSKKIKNLVDFIEKLGVKYNHKNKELTLLPNLVDDNVSVRSARDEVFGNIDQVPAQKYYELGLKKSNFFGKPDLQVFIDDLPEKVNDPVVKKPKNQESTGMDIRNLLT